MKKDLIIISVLMVISLILISSINGCPKAEAIKIGAKFMH